MNLASIRGHAEAIARLRRALGADRLGGAYLLSGLHGVGKRSLAHAFATRVLCEASTRDDACGDCAQCVRVHAGTHPDLQIVERAAERRDIGVEQARALTRWLMLRPLMAVRKVVIVDGAETLSVPAQNALQKTLEEPPGRSVLLLTATTPALLLPTVRSRCQHVRLEPLPDADVEAILAARGMSRRFHKTVGVWQVNVWTAE